MSEPAPHGPLEPVLFELPGTDPLKARWQVTLQEDGTLIVFAWGRRPGRLLIAPSSHNSAVLTTDRLLRETP